MTMKKKITYKMPAKKVGSATPSSVSGVTDSNLLIKSQLNCLRKTRHGYFLYNINDKYIGKSIDLYGEYSEYETRLFNQLIKPDDWVLDVGANLGAFTLTFANKVGIKGRVYAFEPQRFVYQTLCANMALNNIMHAYLYNVGVGDAAGALTIPMLDYRQENNFGGMYLDDFKKKGIEQTEDVKIITIDSLALEKCHFMKIDVEGMELEVLKGADATIRQHMPVVFVENDRKEKSADLIQHIHKLGYQLYWFTPPLYNPDNFYHNEENIYGNTITRNMLCLPPGYDFDMQDFEPVEIE
jgi:FkbM family methyltransferase